MKPSELNLAKLPDYVWCHVHGCVHEPDEHHEPDNPCEPADHAPLYIRRDDYNGPVDECEMKARTELWERIKTAAAWSPGSRERLRAPKLSTLAKFIRDTWPDLSVTCEPWITSTDQKIPGTRLRNPGKGRKGYRLRVREGGGGNVLDHKSGETYRSNDEVCRWIVERVRREQP